MEKKKYSYDDKDPYDRIMVFDNPKTLNLRGKLKRKILKLNKKLP